MRRLCSPNAFFYRVSFVSGAAITTITQLFAIVNGQQGPRSGTDRMIFKIIAFLAAAIPIFLFVRSIFFPRTTRINKGLREFKKQANLAVSIFLFLIVCVVVFAAGKLAWTWWSSLFHPAAPSRRMRVLPVALRKKSPRPLPRGAHRIAARAIWHDPRRPAVS
jgi:hypothetical protein